MLIGEATDDKVLKFTVTKANDKVSYVDDKGSTAQFNRILS